MPRATRTYEPSTDRPATLDCEARAGDIRRITLSHDALVDACVAAGWARDELLQEVWVRVRARQDMPGRYNPERAGLGKYLHVLTEGILKNLRTHQGTLGSPREALTDDGAIDGRTEEPEADEPAELPRVLRRPAPAPAPVVPAVFDAAKLTVGLGGATVELASVRVSLPPDALTRLLRAWRGLS